MPVFVNDFSLICSLGDSKPKIAQGLFSGKQPCTNTHGLVDGQKTLIFEVDTNLPEISHDYSRHNSRNNRLLLSLAIDLRKIIGSAIERYGSSRIGVVIGTTTSGISEGIAATRNIRNQKLPPAYNYALQEIGSPSSFIQEHFGLSSTAYTVSTACSSGGRAIIEAKQLIENNICDAVIAGGSDTLNELTLNGFHSLGALAESRSNPFSQNRCGINIGEGAALFLLSKEQSSFEILGVGESSDGHHISAPDPKGQGAIAAMQMALTSSKLQHDQIDYINLHGTGTLKNDEMEAKSVAQVFPNNPLVSSTKPLTGHTLGAAGAIELAFCLISMKEEKIPLHHWDQASDPRLESLNFVSQSEELAPSICMSNSYGFGGNNTSIIVGIV